MKDQVIDLLRRYDDQPVIRGLVQLVPLGIGSAIDSALATQLERIERDRLRTFFDELAAGDLEVDAATAGSEDFIHAFQATTSAVRRTRRRDKIQLLARLLRSSWSDHAPTSIDEYEEFLSLVDDLSQRELQILALLAAAERAATHPPEDNDLHRANRVWPGFEAAVNKHLGIEPDLLGPMLVRLQRSGCYAEITGAYWSYNGGRGHLTQLYYRLEQVVGEVATAVLSDGAA